MPLPVDRCTLSVHFDDYPKLTGTSKGASSESGVAAGTEAPFQKHGTERHAKWCPLKHFRMVPLILSHVSPYFPNPPALDNNHTVPFKGRLRGA